MSSSDTSFSPDEQSIASSLLKLQQMESSSSERGHFILFGYVEQQASNDQSTDKQGVPKTLFIQYESSDDNTQSIYDVSTQYVKDSTLQYFVYRAKQDTGAAKYMAVSWIGNRVKPIVKAKSTAHKDKLIQLCERTLGAKFSDELTVNLENHKELTDATLLARLFPKNTNNIPKASNSLASRYNASSTTSSSSTGPSQSSQGRNKNNLAAQLRLVLSIDEQGLSPLMQDVQSTSDPTSWAVLAYDENGVLRLKEKGVEQHAVDQIRPHLADDDISYALVKWNMGTELGYGKDTEKALLIVWVGSNINSIRRGKVNQHRAKVYQFVNSVVLLAGEYEVTSNDELTSDLVKNRMLGNKSGVTTETAVTKTEEQQPALESKRSGAALWNMVRAVPKTKYLLRKEAAKAASQQTGKKALSTAANTIKMFASEECAEELEKFAGNDSLAIWALFGYHEDSKNCLRLIESGSKEANSLISDNVTLQKELNEDALAFIIVKLFCKITKGRTKAIVPKFVLVTFKGKKLKPYFKVISANHAGKLKNTISPIIPVEDAFATISDIKELDNFQALLPREEVVGGPDAVADKIGSPRGAARSTGVAEITGVTFEDEQAVQDALKDLQDDTSGSNWVMIGYSGRKKLKLLSTGAGGIEDFKSKISEKEVQYIFYKVFLEELGGSAKIVLIAYCGKEVKMALKAASTPDRIALFKWASYLCGVSSEYQANDQEEINDASISSKVTGSKGKTDGVVSSKSNEGGAAKRFGGKNQELKVADEEKVVTVLKDLKDDNTETNWVLFGYDESGSNLELKQTGTSGLDGLRTHMDSTKVQYALLKLVVQETGYGGSPKVTLIAWVGENVAGMAKAKSSAHRLLLKDFCLKTLPIASEFPANSEQELSEVAIRAKLTGAKGLVEENGAMVATVGTQKGPSHKKYGGTNVNMKFLDEKAVQQDIEDLRNNKSNIKWLMFGYPNAEDYYTTAVVHKGSGGVAGYKQYLKKDTVNYILMRMTFMEYYEVCKVVLVTFVGEDAPSFMKSVSAGHRVNLMEYARKFVSIGGEYQPHDLEEFSDQTLLGKITGAKGGENVDMSAPTQEDDSNNSASRWTPSRDVRANIEVKERNKFSGEYKAIEFSGKEELTKALKDLSAKSDVIYQEEESRLDFIKLKLQGKNMRDVVVEEIGKGSLTEEWREKHLDVNSINIFILAVSTSEGGTGMITKYVFIQWNGNQTKFHDRANASELRQTLYDFSSAILFMGAEIQGCTLPEHVTKKIVLEKLTGSNVRGKEMDVQKKQEKFMKLGKEKSKLSYESEQVIFEALEKLVPLEDHEYDWMLVTYVENKIDVLRLAHTGKGDCEAYKQYLTPTNMCFIVMRVMHAFGYQKDFAETMSKPYYGLVHWKGAEVSVLEKGMSSHHWNNFAKMITRKLTAMKLSVQGSQYHAEHLEEVTMERINKAMRLFD